MAKIMIVDDAAFMRMTLRGILEKGGHEVACEGANGEEAVRLYGTHQPDLVTMDITMPVMDGIEAVRQLIARHPAARILMCSAMGNQRMVVDAVLAGAKDFIVKPFNGERVLESVERALSSAFSPPSV
ncbi:response regulator [Paenibacillus sp. IB182496]|uniref:Response regulator n=1 Tax=Paenibacillus sabuli TaxID=2772509 RepID=A0A927GU80_9BACL|nr:response regulator [Paenibacillus sabuli]MBD2847875.1 response regulator [Paenibacillus sabuli]